MSATDSTLEDVGLLGITETARVIATLAVLSAAGLPTNLQVGLFGKLLRYDHTIEKKGGKTHVLVVHGASYDEEAKKVVEGFQVLGTEATPVGVNGIEGNAATAHAVYVTSTAPAQAVARLCEKHSLLSLSGDPSQADAGVVSISLERKPDGRPQIVVNLARLGVEKHDLSSHILKVARLIQK